MEIKEFKELYHNDFKSMSYSTVNEIKNSYRDMNLLLTQYRDSIGILAPKHWFIDKEDAKNYIIHSEIMVDLVDVITDNLKYRLNSMRRIINRYDSIEEFYKDYFESFMDENKEEDFVERFVRDNILYIIDYSRMLSIIKGIKENHELIIPNYFEPDIICCDSQTVMIEMSGEFREKINEAIINGAGIPEQIQNEFDNIKSVPLTIGDKEYLDESEYVDMYSLYIDPINTNNLDIIMDEYNNGKLCDSLIKAIEEIDNG